MITVHGYACRGKPLTKDRLGMYMGVHVEENL